MRGKTWYDEIAEAYGYGGVFYSCRLVPFFHKRKFVGKALPCRGIKVPAVRFSNDG